MLVANPEQKQLRLEIPINRIDDVRAYHNALLSLLRRIDIEQDNPQLKEDLKVIYSLLSYLNVDKILADDNDEQSSLAQISRDVQFVLCLIREELKSRKLFNSLQKIGLDSCDYRTNLDEIILSTLEMDNESDAVFDSYCEIMNRRSKKIASDDDSVMRQAMKAYYELLNERKRLTQEL